MNDQTRNLKKYKYLCIFSGVICFISLAFQVYISNATALKSKDFQQLYQKKSNLEKDIAYLQFEDSQLSSLSYIEQRASLLGFQEMTEPLQPITPPSLASLTSQ
jgi:hypothetical protein